MAGTREPKKSESIEIRLSHEAKTAFMARCQQDEVTASEAIRALIDARMAGDTGAPRAGRFGWRTIAGVAAGMVLGLTAPALAHANQNSRAAFDQLDRNHDGALSYAEFRAR